MIPELPLRKLQTEVPTPGVGGDSPRPCGARAGPLSASHVSPRAPSSGEMPRALSAEVSGELPQERSAEVSKWETVPSSTLSLKLGHLYLLRLSTNSPHCIRLIRVHPCTTHSTWYLCPTCALDREFFKGKKKRKRNAKEKKKVVFAPPPPGNFPAAAPGFIRGWVTLALPSTRAC